MSNKYNKYNVEVTENLSGKSLLWYGFVALMLAGLMWLVIIFPVDTYGDWALIISARMAVCIFAISIMISYSGRRFFVIAATSAILAILIVYPVYTVWHYHMQIIQGKSLWMKAIIAPGEIQWWPLWWLSGVVALVMHAAWHQVLPEKRLIYSAYITRARLLLLRLFCMLLGTIMAFIVSGIVAYVLGPHHEFLPSFDALLLLTVLAGMALGNLLWLYEPFWLHRLKHTLLTGFNVLLIIWTVLVWFLFSWLSYHVLFELPHFLTWHYSALIGLVVATIFVLLSDHQDCMRPWCSMGLRVVISGTLFGVWVWLIWQIAFNYHVSDTMASCANALIPFGLNSSNILPFVETIMLCTSLFVSCGWLLAATRLAYRIYKYVHIVLLVSLFAIVFGVGNSYVWPHFVKAKNYALCDATTILAKSSIIECASTFPPESSAAYYE